MPNEEMELPGLDDICLVALRRIDKEPYSWTDAREQAIRECRERQLSAAMKRIGELEAKVEGYKEWAIDVKRLTRDLDVILCGEYGAAKQASLCDLHGSAWNLKARAEAAEAKLATVREETLREAAAIMRSTEPMKPHEDTCSCKGTCRRHKTPEDYAKAILSLIPHE